MELQEDRIQASVCLQRHQVFERERQANSTEFAERQQNHEPIDERNHRQQAF